MSVRIGQVYLERGYNRHFKIRAIEDERAVVSSCMRDGSEFRPDGGIKTRIRLDRLARSPYELVKDSDARQCPTCAGSGVVYEGTPGGGEK